LSKQTRAVFARYKINGAKLKLFVIEYDNPSKRDAAWRRFCLDSFKRVPGGDCFVGRDYENCVVGVRKLGSQRNNRLALCFCAPTIEICEALLKKVGEEK